MAVVRFICAPGCALAREPDRPAIGRVGWQLALAGGSTVLFACLLALDGATSILAFAFVACACIMFPLRVYVVQRTAGLHG